MNKVSDRELKRNGEGYWDPTAYKAIKRADAELEEKRNPEKKKRKKPSVSGKGLVHASNWDSGRHMTLKQYIKQKLKILSELGLELTEEEENYLRSLGSEMEIDAYAHRLIIGKD